MTEGQNSPGDASPPVMTVIVGLAAEARVARRLASQVITGGGSRAGARAAVHQAIANGAQALVSFGLAGGLDPTLKPGAMVAPARVLSGTRRYTVDPALAARLGLQPTGTLLDWPHIVASVTAKQRLWQDTGALAVDLESGAVAEAAAEAGLPFAVLRAVCDPAGRDLPPAALAALDSKGAIGPLRIAGSLLRHPGQVPALIALARDATAARQALLRQIERIS